ncbi:MAG: hypothetical protein JNM80_01150 [Phycisphaerae bacterium]|nr:hypothetical protein [Phycisphaerae bacterium]
MLKIQKHRRTSTLVKPFSVGLVLACAAGPALGQAWTFTHLTASGATQSQVRGVSPGGGMQAGYTRFGSNWRASTWNGSTATWTNLHPAGAINSFAHKTDGVQQVGDISATGVVAHAALWSGSAASFVDLNPAGATTSFASGVENGVQVGRANVGGVFQASVWTGSAASWTSLHPAGADRSALFAISNGQFGGFARFGASQPAHAALWTSASPSSFIDLDPGVDPTWISEVWSLHGGQQVGDYGPLSGGFHAALWTGSAASYVNLMPAGGLESSAFAVHSGYQVGYTNFGSGAVAGLWNGTAASWEDLSVNFPASLGIHVRSFARDVWTDGSTLYVAGYGEFFDPNTFSQTQQGFLMTRVIPAPGSLAMLALAGFAAARRRR